MVFFRVREMSTNTKAKVDANLATGVIGAFAAGVVATAIIAKMKIEDKEENWHLKKSKLKNKLLMAELKLESYQRADAPKIENTTTVSATQGGPNITPARKKTPTKHQELQTEQVAGYKKQIDKIRTELFQLHALGDYREDYGIQAARGMVLYGPPGTGKTNIARAVSKTFSRNVKIINGPELKQEFVGISERKLRELFSDATYEWNRRKEESDIYVFIFDEIDALFPKRNGNIVSGSVKADNSMTTQFLTLLDGVNSPRNIFIIGTTNRLEDLDEALLRPGRLELQIEIGLPDENDRLEILKLKTKRLSNSELLLPDVKLEYYARETRGFSGADLENLIKQGMQSAIKQNFVFDDKGNMSLKSEINDTKDLAKVSKVHLDSALQEMQHAREQREKAVYRRA